MLEVKLYEILDNKIEARFGPWSRFFRWLLSPFRKMIYDLMEEVGNIVEAHYASPNDTPDILSELAAKSPLRSRDSFHVPVESWSLPDWACALAGEVGELCNFVKKQHLDGTDRTADIAKEAADVLIYLDLFCNRAGINLSQATAQKFNEVSDRVGSPLKIQVNQPTVL